MLGHSFGGKVALEQLNRHPDGLESAWIVDSAPGGGDPQGSAWEMLAALERTPGPLLAARENFPLLACENVPLSEAGFLACARRGS